MFLSCHSWTCHLPAVLYMLCGLFHIITGLKKPHDC